MMPRIICQLTTSVPFETSIQSTKITLIQMTQTKYATKSFVTDEEEIMNDA